MNDDLIQAAIAARERAIATLSEFRVGAALATAEGRVFTGCNIENLTLGLTVCAERVALWKALSEGYRGFTGIAVVTDSEFPETPCGACRQLLWEFCGDIPVLMRSVRDGRESQMQLSALLPFPFRGRLA